MPALLRLLLVLPLLPLLSGCLAADGGSPSSLPSPSPPSSPALPPDGPASATRPETWYAVDLRTMTDPHAPLELRHKPEDINLVASSLSQAASEWSRQGPFRAVEPSRGSPAGSAAVLELTYRCQSRTDAAMEFRAEVLVDGAAVAAGTAADRFTDTPDPMDIHVQEVVFPMVLRAPVSEGSVLELVFEAKGCELFAWGRGGDWATRLDLS